MADRFGVLFYITEFGNKNFVKVTGGINSKLSNSK